MQYKVLSKEGNFDFASQHDIKVGDAIHHVIRYKNSSYSFHLVVKKIFKIGFLSLPNEAIEHIVLYVKSYHRAVDIVPK